MITYNGYNRKENYLYLIICFGIIISIVFGYVLIMRYNTSYRSINEMFYSDSIYYNDEYYSLKEDVTTYLFMGIDNDGGQADTLILIVADNNKKELFMVPINRNIMADIKVFSNDGERFSIENRQICLAHSMVYEFYDPNIATVEAVSKLLFDVPIDYYISFDMSGIKHISTVVGDVLVTVNENLPESDLILGEKKIINSENIYDYLRVRDTAKIGGAEKRLERQVDFLLACYNKFKSPMKNLFTSDRNFVISSNIDEFSYKFEIIKSFIKTNIDDPIVNGIKYLNYDFSEEKIFYIPHKTQLDEKSRYEVCYMNVDEAKEILLNVFYDKGLY